MLYFLNNIFPRSVICVCVSLVKINKRALLGIWFMLLQVKTTWNAIFQIIINIIGVQCAYIQKTLAIVRFPVCCELPKGFAMIRRRQKEWSCFSQLAPLHCYRLEYLVSAATNNLMKIASPENKQFRFTCTNGWHLDVWRCAFKINITFCKWLTLMARNVPAGSKRKAHQVSDRE